jgi:hypothetical protein
MSINDNTAESYPTCAVILPVSEYALSLLRSNFKTVHYYPEGDIPKDIAAEVDIWYARWTGLPKDMQLEDLPKTKVLQLASGEHSHEQVGVS